MTIDGMNNLVKFRHMNSTTTIAQQLINTYLYTHALAHFYIYHTLCRYICVYDIKALI